MTLLIYLIILLRSIKIILRNFSCKVNCDIFRHIFRQFFANKEIHKSETPYDIHEHFESNYFDVFHGIPVKLEVKVAIPSNEFPTYPFIEKLMTTLAPALKSVCDNTQCKIQLLGRGSFRNQQREHKYRNSGDAIHSHLNQRVHLKIEAISEPIEAFAKIAYSLFEIKKILNPLENETYTKIERLRELGVSIMGPNIPNRHKLSYSDIMTLSYLEKAKHLLQNSQLLGDLNEDCYMTYEVDPDETTDEPIDETIDATEPIV